MREVNHPLHLKDLGVPQDGPVECAIHAMGDAVSLYNARPISTPEEILELFKQVY